MIMYRIISRGTGDNKQYKAQERLILFGLSFWLNMRIQVYNSLCGGYTRNDLWTKDINEVKKLIYDENKIVETFYDRRKEKVEITYSV